MSMWEPFTGPARHAFVRSQELATRLGDARIDTEHLLYGLVRTQPDDPAAVVLAEAGVTEQRVHHAVEALHRRRSGAEPRPGEMVFTDSAKRVVERAFQAARRRQENYLATGHLLLGLLSDETNSARKILVALGVDPQALGQLAEAALDAHAAALRAKMAQPGHAPTIPPLGAGKGERAEVSGLTWSPFTETARKSIVAAQMEAERANHRFIAAAHILLGIIDSGGTAPQEMLERRGLMVEAARERLGDVVAAHYPQSADIPDMVFMPESKALIERSFAEARRLRHDTITPEHLLLAVLRERTNSGTKLLLESGVDVDGLRRDMLTALGGPEN